MIVIRKPVAGVSAAALSRFVARAQRSAGLRGSVDVLLAGSGDLRVLNRRFRGKNHATDVLSFPSGEKNPMGDIAISLGRARVQARERGHSIETEVCILLLHGILHLTGLDHETDSGQMARAELRWQRKLGLPAGLIERSQS